jgi:hypothetical protein
MQSVCPEGACNRFALWRAHGGDVTHEGIRGAVPSLCVARWGLVGENRALRLARVGFASFGHPPRQGGVGGPAINP